MPDKRPGHSVATHITTVSVDPSRQREMLEVLSARAHFMARQPGFMSIRLHRGVSGRHIVNYVQWASKDQLEAAHRAPEFVELSTRFNAFVQDVESDFFDEVLLLEDKK